MPKPLVFVSYSHLDEMEKDKLASHLKVLENSGLIELWIDDKIEGGANWEAEIEQKITKANIAILLITANFLTSNFILSKEVPKFLKRRQGEGLTVFPIIARSCVWESFDWLAEMNVRPKNGNPIWGGKDNQAIDEALTIITREVRNIVQKSTILETKPASSYNKLSFPTYTSFQKDLENLIQQATSNFISIKSDTPNLSGEYTSYKSIFSFEYSTGNTVWQHKGEWYFTCYFCQKTTLQQAKMVFTERVKEIKSLLSSDWKFEEREKPESLHTKEFEAVRKYNTLRIEVKIVAFNSGNNSQVDFKFEQLKY